MNDTTKEIKQLADWCQKARAIIGKGFTGDAKPMEAQIKKVAELLGKLNKQAQIDGGGSNKELLDITMKGFRDLAQKHQDLTIAYEKAKADSKNAKTPKEKSEAKLRVAKAREDVRALIAKMAVMKEDLIADAPLAQAIHHFEVSIANAKVRIRNELTNVHADQVGLAGVQRTLIAWEAEVANNPKYHLVGEVQQLTTQINPLINGVIGGATKKSGETRKLDKKQSKARGKADEKLNEVKQLLQELTTAGQLTPTMGDKLRDGIRQAEALHLQEKWIEERTLLKTLPTRKQCLKAFDEARGSTVQDFGADIETLNAALGRLKVAADEATWRGFDNATRELHARAGDPGRKIKDNQKLVTEFRTHLQKIEEAVTYANDTRSWVALQLVELQKTADGLSLVAPLNRVDDNRNQIELIKVLQNDRRWREARDTAEQLALFMAQQANSAYDEWKRKGPSLRGRSATLNDLRMAVGNPGATPALKAQAEALLKRVAEPQLAQLEKQRDWNALMALHAEAEKFTLGLAGEIKKFKDFGAGREEVDGRVQSRFQRCASALSELERALATAGADGAPVLQPLQARLDELKAEWKIRMASAAEESDLNPAGMEEDMNLLMQAVLSANYGKNLDETVDGQRHAAGKVLFDKAVADLERDGLAPLELLNVSQAAAFRQEISKLAADTKRESDPAQPWAQRVLGVPPIATRVTTALSEAAQSCATLNTTLTGQAEAIELSLRGAKKLMEDKGIWASVARRYEPMFKLLEGELAGLRQLLTTTNGTAAAGNGKLLADLKRRADDIVKLTANNEALDNREERADKVDERLEALRKDKLAKLLAETDKRIAEQLKTMRRDMFGMEPQVMNQVFDEIDTALNEARKELDGVLALQTRAADLEKDLRPRIANLQKSGLAREYLARLLERVGEAMKQAAQASEVAAALVALGVIGTEVKDAEANPEAALTQQKLQKTEEHAQERLKQEYKGRLDVIKDQAIPRVTRAIKAKDGDEGQIEEIDRMIKLAEKSAGNGDYERAIQTLVRTENRVNEVEANPAGTALGDRNALPKHLDAFASKVAGLRGELDMFVTQALEMAPPAAHDRIRPLLQDAVNKIKAQLNPRLFDLYAGTITDTDVDKDKRRAARDSALQRLRELSGFISGQPTVANLAQNPILPLLAPLRLVDSSLTRLEAHLRAAIH